MVELVERHQWGALPPRMVRPMELPTPHVKLWYIWTIDQCYDRDQCAGALSEMQNRDFHKGLADIKYNFIIGNDGRVYEGRGWHNEGSHLLPADFVGFRIDIGFIGRFSSHPPMPLRLVKREEWGARSPQENTVYAKHPLQHVVVWYNTEQPSCETDATCRRAVMEMQRNDIAQGHGDIKYNFVIGGTGLTYEGRGWFFQPSDRLPYSEFHGSRVDIAYIGNYTGKNVLSFTLLDQQLLLVEYGKKMKYLVHNYTMVEQEQKFL